VTRAALAVVAIVAVLAACTPKDGPLMEAGENCQGCHGGEGPLYLGERAHNAKPWSVAGTVFSASGQGVEGAQVHITDANGFSFWLRTNLAGNFYSAETVKLPLTTCIDWQGREKCQQSPVTKGTCNECHNLPEFGAPQAPLVAP
jgi:predicted small lipoprotein YifL